MVLDTECDTVSQEDGDADIDDSPLEVMLVLTDPDSDDTTEASPDCVIDTVTDSVTEVCIVGDAVKDDDEVILTCGVSVFDGNDEPLIEESLLSVAATDTLFAC